LVRELRALGDEEGEMRRGRRVRRYRKKRKGKERKRETRERERERKRKRKSKYICTSSTRTAQNIGRM